MSANVLFDLGARYGEGLKTLVPMLKLDQRWEIHCFEPNPECEWNGELDGLGLRIALHRAAAWVHDGHVEFCRQDRRRCRFRPAVQGASLFDGWGSAVAEVQSQSPGLLAPIQVPCVDFARLVAERPPEDAIVVKMDIEGAEFPVLRRLIATGAISRIQKLFIEWHDWLVPNETPQSQAALEHQVRSRGVEVIRWT